MKEGSHDFDRMVTDGTVTQEDFGRHQADALAQLASLDDVGKARAMLAAYHLAQAGRDPGAAADKARAALLVSDPASIEILPELVGAWLDKAQSDGDADDDDSPPTRFNRFLPRAAAMADEYGFRKVQRDDVDAPGWGPVDDGESESPFLRMGNWPDEDRDEERQPPPLVAAGEVMMIGGAGAAGKSSLATDIALIVGGMDIPGSPFEAAVKGPVLWLCYEEAPSRILARLNARRELLHKDAPDHPLRILDMRGGFPLWGPVGTLTNNIGGPDARGARRLKLALKEFKPALVIVDPALSAFLSEANSSAPVRGFIEWLADLAPRDASPRPTILILGHSTKQSAEDAYGRGSVAGAAAWHDACRCVLALLPGDGTGARGEAIRGKRSLSVVKANLGPGSCWIPLEAVRKTFEGRPHGPFAGFDTPGQWTFDDWKPPEKSKPGKSGGGAARASKDKEFDDLMKKADELGDPSTWTD